MLADGKLSMQAVLGEHHLLSWATISVPLLPVWFWSVVWKHLAFCLPFVDPIPTVMFGSFPPAVSVILLLLLHLQITARCALASYALSSDDSFTPQWFLGCPLPGHIILLVEQSSFKTFQASRACIKLKNYYIPSLSIWFSNLEMWWRQRVVPAKSEE